MKRPQEHEYSSLTAYTRALEEYCTSLEQPKSEPVRLECVVCGTVYANGVPPQVSPPKRERNFCERCGKRLSKDNIHTCTPPEDGIKEKNHAQ